MPLLFCKLIVAPQVVALGPLPVCELLPVCKGIGTESERKRVETCTLLWQLYDALL